MSKGDIFIVDDNPNNLNLLYGILKTAGYQVRAASNGRRAVDTIPSFPPELIMLDIQMPEMDGYEVCEKLKAQPASSGIPVIFISALDDVVDKVRAFQVGAVDFVTKPFHAEEVIARVETQLSLFRLRRELERQNEELARKNEELLRAQRQTNLIFSALSETLPGTVLDGKYRLDRKIGSGGFGAVFRALHLGLDRYVAVKVLRPSPGNDSPEAIERFRHEAISACRLSHPNAVSVLDFGVSSTGIAYLVMELLDGRTLKQVLAERGPLPLEEATRILVPVCEALDVAHAAGVVHRDIKPDNIFLHRGEGGETVKVLDFGIAKLVGDAGHAYGQGITETGVILGTLDYIAPERVSGRAYDGKADVYSVGVVLYQTLAGRLPFRLEEGGGPYAIAFKHVTEDPQPLGDVVPGLPASVADLVRRAMGKEPATRPTARELAAELAAVGSNSEAPR
jgi:CheY-like chemotaxis protein